MFDEENGPSTDVHDAGPLIWLPVVPAVIDGCVSETHVAQFDALVIVVLDDSVLVNAGE